MADQKNLYRKIMFVMYAVTEIIKSKQGIFLRSLPHKVITS